MTAGGGSDSTGGSWRSSGTSRAAPAPGTRRNILGNDILKRVGEPDAVQRCVQHLVDAIDDQLHVDAHA